MISTLNLETLKRRKNCIDLLVPSDKEIVDHVRSMAYEKYYGSKVDTSGLKWNNWDKRFVNLGLFRQGQLVSCLRVALINDPIEYKKLMAHDFDSNIFEMPVSVLCRAATFPGFESMGFHSLLRYYAVILSKEAGAYHIAGTFQKNSSRVKQLSEMGYEFYSNENNWRDFLKNDHPVLIAKLNLLENFEKAIQRINDSILDIKNEYKAIFDIEKIIQHLKLGMKSEN
jgi:hypothetical protein